jgi:hypothetical protein
VWEEVLYSAAKTKPKLNSGQFPYTIKTVLPNVSRIVTVTIVAKSRTFKSLLEAIEFSRRNLRFDRHSTGV